MDDASKFQDGHVILVGSEKMVVQEADTTSNTIDVYARGFGGTDPATHADDTVIYIVGMARLEGDGVTFRAHPDPRRILMADDWPAEMYPLHRDFSGIDEERRGRIVRRKPGRDQLQ